MWSLRWTENPEERDRNPSSPQMVSVAQLVRALVCGTRGRGFETHHSPKIYVIQTRCRSGLQNLDGEIRFLDGVLKLKK